MQNNTDRKIYIASFSGGKDSLATIILAHENNEPLDEIIFSEVMFDKNISGEYPEQMDFIKNKCAPLFEKWGYKFTILHSDKTYMDIFYHINRKGNNIGAVRGFPMSGRCDINKSCKIKSIKDYFKNKDNFIQYIGIAMDEPKRLERLHKGENKISLLEKYGYTEEMAMQKCKEYDLVSPIYSFAKRGGCWFCPNARMGELKYLYENHIDLMDKLIDMEKTENLAGYIWNTLTKTSMADIKERIELEKAQANIYDYMDGRGRLDFSDYKGGND